MKKQNSIIKFTTKDTKFLFERVILQFHNRDFVWGEGGGRGKEQGAEEGRRVSRGRGKEKEHLGRREGVKN